MAISIGLLSIIQRRMNLFSYDVEFLPKSGGDQATPRSKKQKVIPPFILYPIPTTPFASQNQTD